MSHRRTTRGSATRSLASAASMDRPGAADAVRCCPVSGRSATAPSSPLTTVPCNCQISGPCAKMPRYLAAAMPWAVQERRVEHLHPCQRLIGFSHRRELIGRMTDPQQLAFWGDRQAVVRRFDHRPPQSILIERRLSPKNLAPQPVARSWRAAFPPRSRWQPWQHRPPRRSCLPSHQ